MLSLVFLFSIPCFLLAYCFVASIAPVWLLLQPRDFLSSFLLYACLAGGAAGLLLSGADVQYPAFRSYSSDSFGLLVPALFITVACCACSGFHSIVASGTTAKQLATERAAQLIGYGGMFTVTVWAIVEIIAGCLSKKEGLLEAANVVKLSASALLLVLALFVIAEAFRSLRGKGASS